MRDRRSLRRRIEEVMRRREPAATPDEAGADAKPAAPSGAKPARALVFGRLPRSRKATADAAPPTDAPAPPAAAPAALPGRVVESPESGPVLLVEETAAAPAAPAGLDPSELLFVDIEATGLSSSPLFLIGVMTWEGDRLTVRQYLARDYSEEAAAIERFLDEARGRTRLVSFNGRSYDLPYIRMRAAATGVPYDLEPERPHTDLLHEARRAWGESLPDCRLQTLETELLGLPRGGGDIPGADIPDAYHAFVRTGDPSAMLRILRHNVRDLVTLASLLARLPA